MKVGKMNMKIAVKAIRAAKIPCPKCGVMITSDPEMSDHEEGVVIEGYEKKQMVHFVCTYCYYEYPLKRILQKHAKDLSIYFSMFYMEEVMKNDKQ